MRPYFILTVILVLIMIALPFAVNFSPDKQQKDGAEADSISATAPVTASITETTRE